ncbi:hypothetical protein [Rhizobium sp. RAF56]|uniref:hypothetical protein n=1 Tax=Rhizobium sp. RAF56 TaxID=3233062 RepID=UPI003F9A09A3
MKDELYEDRDTDCEMALEQKVQEVVDEAALVGWTRLEARAAIINIALNPMFAETENERSSFRLALVQRKGEH